MVPLQDFSLPITRLHGVTEPSTQSQLVQAFTFSAHFHCCTFLWRPVGHQQSLCVCRFELFFSHREFYLREKALPATSFFVEVFLFSLSFSVSFNLHYRSFLGPRDPLPPCLPHTAVFQCLDCNTQRGSLLFTTLPSSCL